MYKSKSIRDPRGCTGGDMNVNDASVTGITISSTWTSFHNEICMLYSLFKILNKTYGYKQNVYDSIFRNKIFADK